MQVPYRPALAPGTTTKVDPSGMSLATLTDNCKNSSSALKILRYEQYPVMFAPGLQVIFHSAHN